MPSKVTAERHAAIDAARHGAGIARKSIDVVSFPNEHVAIRRQQIKWIVARLECERFNDLYIRGLSR